MSLLNGQAGRPCFVWLISRTWVWPGIQLVGGEVGVMCVGGELRRLGFQAWRHTRTTRANVTPHKASL